MTASARLCATRDNFLAGREIGVKSRLRLGRKSLNGRVDSFDDMPGDTNVLGFSDRPKNAIGTERNDCNTNSWHEPAKSRGRNHRKRAIAQTGRLFIDCRMIAAN